MRPALFSCLVERLATTLTLSRLVDLEAAAADLGPVEGINGRTGRVVVVHLHKSESSGTAGFPIHDHLSRGHRPVLSEQILEFGVVDAEREVSHVDIYTHQSFPFSVGPNLAARQIRR